jgi:hypothetical protein
MLARISRSLLVCIPLALMLSPPVVFAVDDGASARAAAAAWRPSAKQELAEAGESLWQQVAQADPRPSSSGRQLLAYALALCEVRRHPERLERLFALTRSMQDHDPKSAHWGNLKWYWRDAGVTDGNAVEFCMFDALVIWLRHGDWLPEPARQQLRALLDLGIEGCLRHRVPSEYTNIAILNAGNLIVLGEQFKRPDAASEGYRRLDALCLWTAACGIHEFCSPTYFGTDLNGLLFLFTHAKDARQRAQAAGLLQLFWTDIALNWFEPAERLAGCNSRSYNYLYGVGGLDWHLFVQGWLRSKTPGSAERLEPFTDQWSPPPSLRQMSIERLPRFVRQRWGMLPAECRTHMLYRDITLSCCGACYGLHDMPLVVDLPGGREQPRCYFIADGREDPYGKKKYATGSAGHQKALHLSPFWAGAQRTADAVGLVLYRAKDIAAPEVFHLQSHLVLRRTNDGLWLDGKRLAMAQGTRTQATEVPIVAGQSLVLRQGSAAVAIRLLWSRAEDGQPANAALVDDGNEFACLRLSIDHGYRSAPRTIDPKSVPPGAALWIRVGSGLADEQAFDTWRKQFEATAATSMEVSAERFHIAVPGVDGPAEITTEAPFDANGLVRLIPEPYRGVLEVDGQEVGRPLLTAIEPLRSYPLGTGPLETIHVPAGKSVGWEAETGLIVPGMAVLEDADASGGHYVCQPVAALGYSKGSVSWAFDVGQPGRYWLWARVLAPDDKRNSFYAAVVADRGGAPQSGTWQLPPDKHWQWRPLRFDGFKSSTPLDLPAGPCWLQLRTREPGTAVDRLFITPHTDDRPE